MDKELQKIYTDFYEELRQNRIRQEKDNKHYLSLVNYILNLIDENKKDIIENIKTEYYIVTYCFDEDNNLWKSNRFIDKDKALDYYNKIKDKFNLIYFK